MSAVAATARGARHAPGRIGPNAITQVIGAARALESEAKVRQLFRATGIEDYVDAPPNSMVDEGEVAALHCALHSQLGSGRAATIAWLAGWHTGSYILAHRIPRTAQRVLIGLPSALASRLLLAAIERHAWTFAGSARVVISPGSPATISLFDSAFGPGSSSGCTFYAAVFERLFSALIDARIDVVETACASTGAAACVFRIGRRETAGVGSASRHQ